MYCGDSCSAFFTVLWINRSQPARACVYVPPVMNRRRLLDEPAAAAAAPACSARRGSDVGASGKLPAAHAPPDAAVCVAGCAVDADVLFEERRSTNECIGLLHM